MVVAEPQEGAALLCLAGGEARVITAATVSRAARAGDPLARRLVQEVAEALGAGVASIANAFNPCLIVLGGGVTDGLPGLVDLVRQQIEARALAVALRQLEIVRPALGKYAGTVGAAAWARHNVE